MEYIWSEIKSFFKDWFNSAIGATVGGLIVLGSVIAVSKLVELIIY